VLGNIGTHAHQLLAYLTGQPVERLLAGVGAVVPGRTAHGTASLIPRLDGGARGVMWVTKAATGAENALALEVCGEKGGRFREQASANALRFMRNGEPAMLMTRGLLGLHPLARRAARSPPGHPDGFHEAFANLHPDLAEPIAARITGAEPDPLALTFPTADDGARCLAPIEAALRSTESGSW
jgi:predicted dehydrogenase